MMLEYGLLIIGLGISVFFGFYFYKLVKVVLKNQKLQETVLCEQRQKIKENKPYLICYKCVEEKEEVEKCKAMNG